jgi:hypothetical protein
MREKLEDIGEIAAHRVRIIQVKLYTVKRGRG